MKKSNETIFSNAELDNISNILNSNMSILESNSDYCNQIERIAELQEKIITNIENIETKNLFLEYESEMIDNKKFEQVLIYNIGLITGIELNNMKDEIKINSKKYLSKRIIDFSKYLNQEQLKFLEEIKIFINDRLYTPEEFDKIDRDVFAYSRSSIVSHKKINEILEIFAKISSDYEIY